MNDIIWKTKNIDVDVDTGEILKEKDLINYTKISKTKTNTYVQNGHGTVEYTTGHKRLYNGTLFQDTDQ